MIGAVTGGVVSANIASTAIREVTTDILSVGLGLAQPDLHHGGAEPKACKEQTKCGASTAAPGQVGPAAADSQSKQGGGGS